MIKRKAQGMSMNVIIIAALAIIVLIILVVIMGGKFKIFGGATRSCETQGGSCSGSLEDLNSITGCPDNYAKMAFTDCNDKDEVCCVLVAEPPEG